MSKYKLTEQDLRKIVSETIKEVISELDWKTYYNAGKKKTFTF